MMHPWKKIIIVALTVLLLGGTLCGCFNSAIKEDDVKENYADVDPDEGVAKTVVATLYYRLGGEAYLAGVSRNVLVHENERTEYAILRTLISGVAEPADNLNAVFDANVSITDVNIEGGIVYVTLSPEFLDEGEYEAAKLRARKHYDEAMSEGELSEAQLHDAYQAALTSAKSEMLLKRRLAYYSIVNTLTGYSENIMVICQVQLPEGEPERLSNEQLGIQGDPEADSNLLEAQRFSADIVANGQRTALCALDHLQAGEYEAAYPLFNYEGTQEPTYEGFEQMITENGRLKSYEFISSTQDGDENGSIEAKVSLLLDNNGQSSVKEVKLNLIRDINIYKIDYDTFIEALG